MDHNLDQIAHAFAVENDLSYALIGRFDPWSDGMSGFGTGGKGITIGVMLAAAATMGSMARTLVQMISEQTGEDPMTITLKVAAIMNAEDREESARWITETKEPDDGA